LRFDAFVRIEEGNRDEFVEFVPDKVIEAFSLVDATVEDAAGLNDVSTNTIVIIMQEIMLYFIPVERVKRCIKKIHRL